MGEPNCMLQGEGHLLQGCGHQAYSFGPGQIQEVAETAE
jgi:hypothetical protein